MLMLGATQGGHNSASVGSALLYLYYKMDQAVSHAIHYVCIVDLGNVTQTL